MATNRGKAATAPRSINVQKFAESRGSELESLTTIVANRLNDDFRSRRNDRRRTTGHDDRVGNKNGGKRKRRGDGRSSGFLNDVDGEKKLSRRVRRRMEFRDGSGNGFSSSGDGIKRLRTHVWHAKRFTMTKLWGFHLPLGLQGRGRGSRALLKWYDQGALVHDASYFTCVELEGLQESILSVLNTVLLPSLENKSEDDCRVLSGAIRGNAMLHHVESSSQAIAPVTYMWRPFQLQNIRTDDSCGHVDCDGSHYLEYQSSHRQLWMWIHASAIDEGFEALKEACSKLMKETGNVITVSSLDGKVTQFHVMGCKALHLLQKVLRVVCSDNGRQLNPGSVLKPHSDPHHVKYIKIESEDKTAPHSIASLTVKDPRDLLVGMPASQDEAPTIRSLGKTPITEDEGCAANTAILDDGDDMEVSSLELASNSQTDETLWDIKSGLCSPVNEQDLSAERHNFRSRSFAVADQSSKASDDTSKEKLSWSCPIMLVKDAKNKGSHTGWTIILPVRWAKTFWMPLVLNGAHVIGLRERRWIASEMGVPYFPSDFPDCKAYASYKASEAAKFDQEADRRPLSVRPVKVPTSAPWDGVKPTLDADFSKPAALKNNQNLYEAVAIHSDFSGTSDSASLDTIQQNREGNRFSGTVTRTARKLSCFVNQSLGQHFPLFPFSVDKKLISEWAPSEPIDRDQIGNSLQNKDRSLNFVRVTLHAYREGVFEEGAVVCAPLLADIQSWKTSLDGDEERLHIPQPSASTYFSEDAPGKWVLQIPDDPYILRTHRWPIGFVTSGFTRGSKKPATCAFCEASLLGRIRQQQWMNLPAKKRKMDIYVLVRNLRSNTYRLAVANIVLEHQAVDIAFI